MIAYVASACVRVCVYFFVGDRGEEAGVLGGPGPVVGMTSGEVSTWGGVGPGI